MNMKRISIIVMAMALILGLPQCKKEQSMPTTNEGGPVAITLDIKNNGSTKMDVNTGTGEVTYEEGDVIYVASGGHYIGTLTHDGTNFVGTITDPVVGEPLHFYFLGNVEPAEALTAGTTQSCSVIISDQTEHLPVIEYAPSNETYTSGMTVFTATLLNKCALVKFNVTTASEAAICLTGFNNKVTVDFSENNFSYSQENDGVITLPAGNGEKWAILLPQNALEAGETGSAYSVDNVYMGTLGAVPAIIENNYLTAGIDVSVTMIVKVLEQVAIQWVRYGPQWLSEEEMARYGLIGGHSYKDIFATIYPLDSATLYVCDGNDFANITTDLETAKYFAKLTVNGVSVDKYRNISVDSEGGTDYNDMLAVIDPNGDKHLVHIVHANIEYGSYGTQITITGEAKSWRSPNR